MAIRYCAKGNPENEVPEMDKNPFYNCLGREIFIQSTKYDDPKNLRKLEQRVDQGEINSDLIETIHAPNQVNGQWFSLTSQNPEIADASYEDLKETIQTAYKLKIPTVVVHGDAIDLDPSTEGERETIKKAHQKLADRFRTLHNPAVKLALETQPRRVYDTIPNYGISANATPEDFEEIQEFLDHRNIPFHLCIDEEHVYKAAIGEFLDFKYGGAVKNRINLMKFMGEPERGYVYGLDKLYRDLMSENLQEVENYIQDFMFELIGTTEEELKRIAAVHVCGYEWKDHCVFMKQDGKEYFIPKSHNPPIPNETLYVDRIPVIDQINHGLVLIPLSELQIKIPAVLEMDRNVGVTLPDGTTKTRVDYSTFDGTPYSFEDLIRMSVNGLNKVLQN